MAIDHSAGHLYSLSASGATLVWFSVRFREKKAKRKTMGGKDIRLEHSPCSRLNWAKSGLRNYVRVLLIRLEESQPVSMPQTPTCWKKNHVAATSEYILKEKQQVVKRAGMI